MSKRSNALIVTSFFLMLISLSSCSKKKPFDRYGWNDGDGIDFPQRYMMVDDLVANHKLKGLTYKQVINLLHYPQRNSYTDRSFSYEITRKMSGVDTVYAKNLVLSLSKDSVVTGVKVTEKNYEQKKPKK